MQRKLQSLSVKENELAKQRDDVLQMEKRVLCTHTAALIFLFLFFFFFVDGFLLLLPFLYVLLCAVRPSLFLSLLFVNTTPQEGPEICAVSL